MPNGTPTKSASSTDDTPTSSEMRVPWMMRESMSRPNWSVPSGCSRRGSEGASSRRVARRPDSWLASSRVADAWIQEGVRQVHDQVNDHERDRGDEGEPLHLLVVARDD